MHIAVNPLVPSLNSSFWSTIGQKVTFQSRKASRGVGKEASEVRIEPTFADRLAPPSAIATRAPSSSLELGIAPFTQVETFPRNRGIVPFTRQHHTYL